jgi:hypothetical protein
VVPPLLSDRIISCLLGKKLFPPASEEFLSVQTRANPSTAYQIKLFAMKDLVTKSALVSIFNSKQHDFLYIIKQVNSELFLPRVPKAVVKDMIKSDGLYNISYRIYTNEKGYESIYISKAAKIMTK